MTDVAGPPPWPMGGFDEPIPSADVPSGVEGSLDVLVEVGCFARQGVRRSEMQDAVLVGSTIVSLPTESPIWQTFRRPSTAGAPMAGPPLAFAVLDGVGGVGGGHEASSLSALILADLIAGSPSRELGDIVRNVDTRICDLAGRLGEIATMACTVAGIRVRSGGYEAFNAGDSRILALRDGYLVQYSTDHERNGRLTQYLGGGLRNVEPYVDGFRPARVGDLVLLCTDGLSRHVSTEAIQGALAGPSPLEQLWELAAGADDDVSVVLVRWSPVPVPLDEIHRAPDVHEASETGERSDSAFDAAVVGLESSPTAVPDAVRASMPLSAGASGPLVGPQPAGDDRLIDAPDTPLGVEDPGVPEDRGESDVDGASVAMTDWGSSRVRRWLRR